MWRIRLSVTRRDGDTEPLVLEGQRFGIGRTPARNTIVLRDANVARRHCELWVDPEGQLIAEDLGSSNGMWVDERRAERCPVGPGNTLYIGDFRITVESVPERIAEATDPPNDG